MVLHVPARGRKRQEPSRKQAGQQGDMRDRRGDACGQCISARSGKERQDRKGPSSSKELQLAHKGDEDCAHELVCYGFLTPLPLPPLCKDEFRVSKKGLLQILGLSFPSTPEWTESWGCCGTMQGAGALSSAGAAPNATDWHLRRWCRHLCGCRHALARRNAEQVGQEGKRLQSEHPSVPRFESLRFRLHRA